MSRAQERTENNLIATSARRFHDRFSSSQNLRLALSLLRSNLQRSTETVTTDRKPSSCSHKLSSSSNVVSARQHPPAPNAMLFYKEGSFSGMVCNRGDIFRSAWRDFRCM